MTSMKESSGYNNDSYMSDFEKGCISSNNNSPLTSSNSGYGSNNISDVSKKIIRRRKKKGESIRSAFELQHGDKKLVNLMMHWINFQWKKVNKHVIITT